MFRFPYLLLLPRDIAFLCSYHSNQLRLACTDSFWHTRCVYDFGDLLFQSVFLWLHLTVPVVFDRVVGSSRQKLRNSRPFVAKGFNSERQDPLLMKTPFVFFNTFLQMIVPSLSALLALSEFKALRNSSPVLCSILSNKCF